MTTIFKSVQTAPLAKRMLAGAAIGLALISLFLITAGEGNPEWGRFWYIRPLVIVPLAGAMGGAFNYFVHIQGFQSDWAKWLGMLLSLIVFIIGLWLGAVLGLDGTYWN